MGHGLTHLAPKALISALADAAIFADAKGRVLLANDEAVEAFGFEAADMTGQPVEQLIPEAGPYLRRLFDPASTHGDIPSPTWLTVTARRRDGSSFPADMALRTVGSSSDPAALVTIRNAAVRQEGERALWERRELEEQLSRVQRLEAIGRLAGGVAHDFNNLLQVIGGHVDLILDSPSDEDTRLKLLIDIRRSIDRAGLLTRQLLAFGRRQVLRPQVVDLNDTVTTLQTMLARVIGENITLAAHLSATDTVEVDPGQLEQVVLNLVVNARDAIGTHSGTVEIQTKNLRLRTPMPLSGVPVEVPAGAWVQVSVRDTGVGMTPETAARAFEPFFTTKGVSHGSGLGLSMVYGIVKQSGGYVWIDSTLGHGTTVNILLPALPEGTRPAPPPQPRAADVPAPAPVARAHACILVVEDETAVRELLTAFLEDTGYTVLTAGDGRTGMALFDQHGDEIDLVITDVVMPHANGTSLGAAVHVRRPGVPILYLSGYLHDETGEIPLDPLGTYLQKPVSRSTLLQRVHELLSVSTARQSG